MASSVLTKDSLPVDEITTNIRNLVSGIRSGSIKNLRTISQGLSLSNRLDREEGELDAKQKKISAESLASTTDTLDRYQEGYADGLVRGVQSGFENGLKKGAEYGEKSVLENIIESLGGKSPALIATVLGALGLEMLNDYITPAEQPYGPGQPMEGTLVTGQGGGTPFHIDTRFARDLPLEQQVLIFDSMAQQLESEGRVAEMGQAGGVSGQRYPVNGTMQEKIDFLRKAQSGHHAQREMAAMDYFIPKKEETRFGPSAEYAPIPAPNVPGYRVQYWKNNQMAGYDIIDEKTGRVVGRTLHGDPKLSTLKPVQPKKDETYPAVSPDEPIIIEDKTIWTQPGAKHRGKGQRRASLIPQTREDTNLYAQDMEPNGATLVAVQPVISQTMVNNQMGSGGGSPIIISGVPTDNRIITLAKNIS